ncbi:2TM domain-containing protein [Chloroflexota bacterium]
MAQELSEEEVFEEAKKRVKAKRDFYRNLVAYLAVNAVLVIIWALSGDAGRQTYGPGDWTGGKWFLWPLCIWGAFVVLNFLQVFIFKTSVLGEKKAIDKEMEKIKKE